MHKIISLIFMTLFLFSCKNRKKDLLPNLYETLSNKTENEFDKTDDYYSHETKTNNKILNLKGYLSLKFNEQVTVKSNTNGFTKHIYASEGKFVNKGETIASIEAEKVVDLQEDFLIIEEQIKKNRDESKNLKSEENGAKKLKSELDLLNIRLRAIEQKTFNL